MGLPRGGAELLLLLGSLLLLLVVALAAEIAARAFSGVHFLGNSRELFVSNAFGASKGNAPNAEAVSFGIPVFTDEHGFRVPKGGLPDDAGKPEAILLLGDSVAFGPAVEEEKTFAGLLRARLPARRIYNASVIGYATRDYRNVVEAFLPRHAEVSAAVLVYCLNDVSTRSAREIDRYLEAGGEVAPERQLAETLRGFGPLRAANDFLRSRSKLYLLLKQRLLASRERGWEAVAELYAEDRAADVERAVLDIAEVDAALKRRAVRFVVVLAPFEFQLRNPENPAAQVPQRMLGSLLSERNVRFIDPRPYFHENRPSADYFLAYDPMHLSEPGHRVMAEVIAEALEN